MPCVNSPNGDGRLPDYAWPLPERRAEVAAWRRRRGTRLRSWDAAEQAAGTSGCRQAPPFLVVFFFLLATLKNKEPNELGKLFELLWTSCA